MNNDKKITNEGPDLKQLVRSLQRIEGKSDCFATTPLECDGSDCQWYCYCLKEIKKAKGKNDDH